MKITFCLCTFSPDGNSRIDEVKTVIRRTSPRVDRTIVIDGGSTDGIIEWLKSEECKKLNVEVYVHPWMDDPPGQRNRYLRYADGDDWLVILDADELLEEPGLYTLHQLAEESEKNGVTLVGLQSHDIIVDNVEGKPVYENLAEHWAPSFFKHGPEVHYSGHTHVTLHVLPGVRFNSHYRYFHIKTVADQWIRSCFTPGQRVFTTDGYTPIEDVKVGQKVIDMNGNPRRVTKTFKHEVVNEDMIVLHTLGAPPITVTKEHQFLVAEGEKCLKSKGHRVGSKGNRRNRNNVLPCPRRPRSNNWCGCCPNTLDYREYKWKEAKDLTTLDFVTFPVVKALSLKCPISAPTKFVRGNQYKSCYKNITLSNDFMYLCGLYISEGNCEKSNVHSNNYDRVCFSINKSEDKTIGSKIRRVIKNQFGNVCWRESKESSNGLTIHTSVTRLGNWLQRNFGKLAPNKKLPYVFLSTLTDKQLIYLLRGIWHGDSSCKHDTSTLTMSSPHVIAWVYAALIRLSYTPYLREISLDTLNRNNKGFQHKHPMHRIVIPTCQDKEFRHEILGYGFLHSKKRHNITYERGSTNAIWVSDRLKRNVTNKEIVKYTGPVYNLEVEDTESYLVAGATVHNCRNYWTTAKIAQNVHDNTWKEFRETCTKHGLKYFYELVALMRKGEVPGDLVKFFIDNKDDDNPELRSLFVTYFVLLHPELNYKELSNRDFEFKSNRKPVTAIF